MKLLAALILAMLMAAPSHAQRVSFGLFGDTPYNAWERRHLPELSAAQYFGHRGNQGDATVTSEVINSSFRGIGTRHLVTRARHAPMVGRRVHRWG